LWTLQKRGVSDPTILEAYGGPDTDGGYAVCVLEITDAPITVNGLSWQNCDACVTYVGNIVPFADPRGNLIGGWISKTPLVSGGTLFETYTDFNGDGSVDIRRLQELEAAPGFYVFPVPNGVDYVYFTPTPWPTDQSYIPPHLQPVITSTPGPTPTAQPIQVVPLTLGQLKAEMERLGEVRWVFRTNCDGWPNRTLFDGWYALTYRVDLQFYADMGGNCNATTLLRLAVEDPGVVDFKNEFDGVWVYGTNY